MKSTPDDYQPRPMDVLCQSALEILREADGHPIRCGYIGGLLFPDAIHRGSAPFARIVGKAMRRLDSSGLAVWRATGCCGWVVTVSGRKCDYSS